MPDLSWLALALVPVSALLMIGYYRSRVTLSELRERFAPIASADEEARRIKEAARSAAQIVCDDAERARASAAKQVVATQTEVAAAQAQWARELSGLESQKADLATEYQSGRALYDQLKTEVALLEENLEDISFGVFRPHFTFQTSDEYKIALEELWLAEKALINNGQAALSRETWQVGGDRRAGERMTKQYTKLLLRSFNAECDAAIAKVSWNNLATMSARIRKSFDALNQLGSVMQMELLGPYRDLKLRELQLTHEQDEKKQEEKEEARLAREQMREEEKVQRELAAAHEEADKEERAAEKALEKARKDAGQLDEQGRALMADRIRELESQLAAAQEQKERVKAQAELTKCGHVYILSNVGSFGEQIVKIGMTRRLEPRERVAELSDASVPFPFDVHTLIYTDNAPALESELHNQFWENRINLANNRKEFFQVPIADVEDYLCKRGLKCTFNRLAEAKEYRQTCSDREQAKAAVQKPLTSQGETFPAGLFNSTPG
jgi:chromosome segregation ATPase